MSLNDLEFAYASVRDQFHLRPSVSLNLPLNPLVQLEPCLGQVVHLLEVEPELRAVAEELRQAQSSIGRDRSPAMNDVADTRGRNANFHRQRVLRNAQRNKKLLAQHLARMRRNSLQLPSRSRSLNRHFILQSVVIGDLHIVRSIVLPDKADAVLIVDPYAVLSAPFARQSLQSISRRSTQVVERACRINLVELAQGRCPYT